MKATIQDIARDLGISLSTVSRSLRQHPSIHPRTRARVAEAAVRLGYEGRQQRISRPESDRQTIGILLAAGDADQALMHENSVRMLQGISEECDRNGIAVVLHTISQSKMGRMAQEEDLVPSAVRDRTADAMILVGPQLAADVAFIATQVPTIALSWLYEGVSLDTVLVDNVNGTAALVKKLAAAGHRKLAWVHQQYKAPFFTARHAGFIHGCLECELEVAEQGTLTPLPLGNVPTFNTDAINTLLKQGVTGFVCANDSMALPLIADLATLGINVPLDVSVTGFDALTPSTPGALRLDTVDAHFADMGRDAVRLALRRLENPTARVVSTVVTASVVAGGSIGQVKDRPAGSTKAKTRTRGTTR